MPTDRLSSLLERGHVLVDGAMGSELLSRGADPGHCLEELNLHDPTLIRSVHLDYIAAGADIIETNTFGANRFRLGEHYVEGQLEEINVAGARLAVEARNASGQPVLVAGSVGPLGRPVEPIGAIKASSAELIFSYQMEALVRGGVDLLILETFAALHELKLALGVAREVAPDLPVIVSMRLDEGDVDAAEVLAREMAALDVPVVGVNCSVGPDAALEMARPLVDVDGPAVLVMPNAGLPERVSGRLVYSTNPDYFGATVPELAHAGVTVMGGCCGTRPRHVAAMRRALDRLGAPGRPVAPSVSAVAAPSAPAEPAAPSKLAEHLARGDFAFSVELTPPRGIDARRVLAGAQLLRAAGVDFVNVPDSAMARLRMGAMTCATLVQQQAGLEAIAHFTTRDRNVMAIQSELIGAHALGVRNVLCMRGDPPGVGDYPDAATVWEVSATGLITILANLNRGVDANGARIGDGAGFFIGAAFNPTAESLEREVRLLRRKLDAGAAFIVTNAVYDPAALLRLREAVPDLSVPVVAGVMPLASSRQAAYLQHEVPGIVVPEEVRARIDRAGADAPRVGVEMAVELLGAVRGAIQGAYVIPAVGRYDLAAQLVRESRQELGLELPTVASE
jgi:homocysteine S-methyltransferase